MSDVAEAAVTEAFTTPKNTMLFAAVVLNPVPVMVTVVPMGPDEGLKELITGCANAFIEMNKGTKKSRMLFSSNRFLDRDV